MDVGTKDELKQELVNTKNLCLRASLELIKCASINEFQGKLFGEGKTLTIKSFASGASGLINRIASGAEGRDLKNSA